MPNPVTGSQPSIASNPLLPLIISLNASGCWYINGLINPRGDLPEAKRIPLSLAIIPAMTGVEAEVPLSPPQRSVADDTQ